MKTTLTRRIQMHYNLLAPFYYGLWGHHVHHGYWTDVADTTDQAAAQERLIAELYSLAERPQPERILDVGCGYGGSLQWFARHIGAQGLGITLSPVQRMIGQFNLRRSGLHNRVQIQVADAQQVWPLSAQSVDLVWCVECTEHLVDRLHFARQACRVLRPGGTLCVAAWLAGTNPSPAAVALQQEVAQGMLCYPFGTLTDYQQWFESAGLQPMHTRIITPHVTRTWDICIALRDQPLLRHVASLLGRDVQAFTNSFTALRQAYAEGAMEYGLLVARKEA